MVSPTMTGVARQPQASAEPGTGGTRSGLRSAVSRRSSFSRMASPGSQSHTTPALAAWAWVRSSGSSRTTVFPAVAAKILVSSAASAPWTAAAASLSHTAIIRRYTEFWRDDPDTRPGSGSVPPAGPATPAPWPDPAVVPLAAAFTTPTAGRPASRPGWSSVHLVRPGGE